MVMPGSYDRTELTDAAPGCGGDFDALSLAVPLSHFMVGTISA
jgi:hypothetical protein